MNITKSKKDVVLPAFRYNSELDKIKAEDYFPAKLEKAKAYFREHGVPDFDKILKETAETKK